MSFRAAMTLLAISGVVACSDGTRGTAAESDEVITAVSSKGSGGLACTKHEDLGHGRSACVATIGASEVKILEPASGSGPVLLGAYLHGDGAGAHKSNSAMNALVPWADKHHAIFISVLSPNKCAWWQDAAQTDCSETAPPVADAEGANADVLKNVLDAVRAAYDVSLGNAYYYGSSGGSIFLSKSFLRKYGDAYPGIYALNCGGEKTDRPFAWETSAEKRAHTKLFFTYGDHDYLKDDIEAAIPFYGGLGFSTDTKVVPNAAHCEFDGHGRAAEIFEANSPSATP